MERDDYNSEDIKTGVQTSGTPEGEMKNREYLTEGKDSFPASSAAENWHGNRINPKKGFTGYLQFIWPYALLMAFIFFVFLFIGYNSAASFPSMAETLRESFSSRFASIMTMNPLFIMLTIFLNNAFLSLLFLVLGLALGILPILFVAFNGYVVGVIVYLVAQERGLLFILFGLLPHGILELPMVFLAAGIGLRLGYQVFSALIGRPTHIKREFKEGLMFYFYWILPLLLVAAIIETFITPIILGSV
ncbi:Integral membrane protein [Methanosarcina barkeri 3]|uniref:Integral membrane protein n=1 Tax=Methanosarcina barkeri 3 TaxID=1434107 RepID=A0A0E3SMC8_METBA|nr:stage II sporulation protein M [Methanosarcina barkeri]AKB83381.1 Integral membrane protein [Methanosarcina barkeri 3]